MHTGLADAVDLGWKLAAVLKGWGGEGLLDSYEAERKPIALDNVQASRPRSSSCSTAMPSGSDIDEDTPAGAALRQKFAAAYPQQRQVRSKLFTDNLQLGYCYEPSPISVPDGSTRPPVETPDFVPVARPGTRAPHAWIGEERSTLDLFGQGFVLLRLGADPPDGRGIAAAAAERARAARDRAIFPIAMIAALYERRLVLVRPDGHVAWRADDAPAEPLRLIDRVRGARVV